MSENEISPELQKSLDHMGGVGPNGWWIGINIASLGIPSKYKTRAEIEANAALIVRAVNSHDNLVSALEELCNRFDSLVGEPFHNPDDFPWAKARAALRAAKRGE